jgi:hypothetical protein
MARNPMCRIEAESVGADRSRPASGRLSETRGVTDRATVSRTLHESVSEPAHHGKAGCYITFRIDSGSAPTLPGVPSRDPTLTWLYG